MATNGEPYQLFIPSHPKDHVTLPYVIEAAFENTDAEHCHLVVPDPNDVAHLRDSRITIHADRDVVDFDKEKIAWRPGWVYQQFLKLFQQVTDTDYYLCLCSDLVMVDKYPVFRGGHPVMVAARDAHHVLNRYVRYTEAMLNIGHMSPMNFISDGPLYKKSLIQDMLDKNGYTRQSFMEKTAEIVKGSLVIGDAELYSSWAWYRSPGLYRTARVRNHMNGLYGESWTEEKIEEKLAKVKEAGEFDTVSFHSWGP